VFHRFKQAKFDNGALIFKLKPIFATASTASKMKLASKVVKIDSK
jgi:hypothetical protein